MSGPGAHAGSSAGNALRKGVGMFHGAGEAIRGNINAAVDSAAGDKDAVARDEAIASRGADEMDRGHTHSHTATTAPATTGAQSSTVPGTAASADDTGIGMRR
ncbi:hypothetical protein M011DRAFT_525722 [Sporormia fimetaria CBS 119925]|uniref:Uncharacterized protein n=1 Tax=Sporormia fimetaria CBS 119925 TaxID=1340428 RepID=A0A6A6VDV4_9PLEO|nr:hypothetical protein M011DRAFT_525722 [Sporormia fimetaria CBS 119925]